MKKVLVVLLVSAFVATFASAEGGPTWGAWGRTGFVVASGSSSTVGGTTTTTPVVQKAWPGWNGGAYQIHLGINYDGEYIGYHAAFNNVGFDTLANYVNLEASLKVVPDLFTLSFGSYNEGDTYRQQINAASTMLLPDHDQNIGRLATTGNFGYISAVTANPNGGVALVGFTVAPKDSGFSTMLGLPVGATANTLLADNLGCLYFAAKYAIAGVGTISLGTAPQGTAFDRNVFLGFSLTAIKDLTIVIDGSVDFRVADVNTGAAATVKNDGKAKINAGADWTMDAFNLKLATWFLIGTGDANLVPQTTEIYIDLSPRYNLGDISIGLFGEFGSVSVNTAGTTVSGISYTIFPNLTLNACGLNLGFKLDGTSATNAGVTTSSLAWSIPVGFDISF